MSSLTRKLAIGTLLVTLVGAGVGYGLSYALYPAMGASVFILVAGAAAVVGLIGGSLVTLWVYWE